VKEAVRTIFESARELQEGTRSLRDLPSEEQSEAAQEIVRTYQEKGPPALQEFRDYVAEHCPGLEA
jgi:hypothetical protein